MYGQKFEMTWEVCGRGLEAGASIPLTDRGFRFGQHLFETIAVRDGRWLFFREHIGILQRSASEAGFRCDTAALELLKQFPDSSELEDLRDGIARVYWTAGDGSPATPPSLGRIFLLWEPRIDRASQETLKLLAEPFVFTPLGLSGGCWKTGNYWQNLMARETAISRGCDEILMANTAGQICSASMGNVFFKAGSDWFTPPLGEGVRPGTTRGWLLAIGFGKEMPLRTDAVAGVDSWMVTNSRIGPAPAFTCGRKKIVESALAELWSSWLEV